MSYAILRTDKASDQLYAIIQYIAESSGSVDVALSYLDTFGKRNFKAGYYAPHGKLSPVQHPAKAGLSSTDR